MDELTTTLKAGTYLNDAHIAEATRCLVDPALSAEVKADFLRALAVKGETPAEIAAFVQEFLKLAVDPGIDRTKPPPGIGTPPWPAPAGRCGRHTR